MAVVDAHQHFLDIERLHYPWLRPNSPIFRSWTPSDLAPELGRTGVDATLLVQAADDQAETAFMLDIAERYPWVAGVVGWVPLAEPDRAAAALEAHARDHPRFRGVRHLIHLEDDPDWLVRPEVLEALRGLAGYGLVFEVSVTTIGHLEHVPALAEAVPDLALVVPHLGFPPITEGGWEPWASAFAHAAAYPQVSVKLSRLEQAAATAGLQRYVDHALEVFGPERMMWASNWPVSLRDGGYAELLEAARATLRVLSAEEHEQVLGGNAARIYGLEIEGTDAIEDRS